MDQGPVYGGGEPVIGRFADDEWWNLLALAHECGFDPNNEYVPVVYPAEVGETHEVDDRLASGLYIGVSMMLHQDTLPFATTWDSDDSKLHFRWVIVPGYTQRREPENSQNPNVNPDFAFDKAALRQLLEYLSREQVLVERVEDSATS